MYEYDLVMFGTAGVQEAQEPTLIMEMFGKLSGLRINNDKFVVWFSQHTTI
jgi:hypothetical protein